MVATAQTYAEPMTQSCLAGKNTIDLVLGNRNKKNKQGVLADIEMTGAFPDHPFRASNGGWTRLPWIAETADLELARRFLSSVKVPTTFGFRPEQLLKKTAKGK